MKKFIKRIKELGWKEKKTTKRWGKHLKFLCPCWKHRLTISNTPSDMNAIKMNIMLINKFGCTKY